MLELKAVNLKRAKVDTLVVPVCEDREIHTDKTSKSLNDAAKALAEFKGKKGDVITLFQPAETRITRVVFFGLGNAETLTGESFRAFAGNAVKFCINAGLSTMTIATPSSAELKIDAETLFSTLMEGACLGNHIFDRYKKDKEKAPVKTVVLMATAAQKKAYSGLAKSVAAVCGASVMAREWVTTPSNDKRPEVFAEMIRKAARSAGLKVRIMDDRWLEKQQFGAMLAVGQGSSAKPRLVTVEYAPQGANKTVVLVGKGVTFDSGGINLKPSGSIETMKMDMSGAAAVAGTMLAVARIKPGAKVVGVMPLVENMPSGAAIRPGDIIRSYEGKTIEIGNTDAEGRLILIDAMAWAIKQYKPDTMIDLATLTGACVVALGEKIAGVFSKDPELADAIVASGEKTHERCWQLPLPEDYKELLKNEFADLNNVSSGRWGGAITAALFLSEFVGDTCWAHIDIAGPAWAKKASDYCEAGGTGFGVRLLCDLIGKL
ncbi:MAG: leucyl aminopeptidase [Desulfosarcina sp.]|nr:leucyl aminopeptidase [Desulfosarcina sp.]MBC2742054.1 leucyl aminopeptidase [Desulfosarcina sp.]MBC2764967.1 leucyl aminopeptidase [Desulfosarcina sp.]